jgi:hypothetical protein
MGKTSLISIQCTQVLFQGLKNQSTKIFSVQKAVQAIAKAPRDTSTKVLKAEYRAEYLGGKSCYENTTYCFHSLPLLSPFLP